MTDFTLTPADDDSDRPERRRPVRLVSSGLAPTSDLPRQRGPDPPPAYAPCEACGQAVLTGETARGQRLALDVQTPCCTVLWGPGEPRPSAIPAYTVLRRCVQTTHRSCRH